MADNNLTLDGISARIAQTADRQLASDIKTSIDEFMRTFLDSGDAFYATVTFAVGAHNSQAELSPDGKTVTIRMRTIMDAMRDRLREVWTDLRRSDAYDAFLAKFQDLENAVDGIRSGEE